VIERVFAIVNFPIRDALGPPLHPPSAAQVFCPLQTIWFGASFGAKSLGKPTVRICQTSILSGPPECSAVPCGGASWDLYGTTVDKVGIEKTNDATGRRDEIETVRT